MIIILLLEINVSVLSSAST